MPYLNLDLDYFDHPKTKRLVGLLGRGADVLPIRLWAYCGKYHAESGRLTGYSPQEIEKLIDWWGKSGEAVEALLKVGFLEDKNGLQVHDWKEEQGHIHALKIRNKKVAKNRWKNIKNAPSTVDTSGIPRGNQKRTSGIPHPSVPSVPSKPSEKSLNVNGAETTLRSESGDDTPPPGSSSLLLEEVVQFLDDEGSRAFYAKMARGLGDGLFAEAFGELRMRVAEGRVRDKRRYFTTLLQDYAKRANG